MSSSPSPTSGTEPASPPARAVLVSADPARTLAALGAAFEDIALLGSGQVAAELERLAGTPAPLAIVVDGPAAAEVTAAVVDHVLARPERLLAVAVTEQPTPLGGPEYAGLGLVGAGRLGALPVTWWSADPSADLSRVPRTSTAAAAAGGPSSVDADTFAAQAQLLRADLDREPASEPAPAPAQDPAGATAPPGAERTRPAARPERAAPRLRHRVAFAGALVAAGAVAGAAVAQLGADVVRGVALLGTAALILVLLSGVLALRTLAAELRAQAAGTRRLRKHLDRGMSQLAGRAQASDAKLSRMRATLRQIEARVAVVSSARVDVDRRAATDDPDLPR